MCILNENVELIHFFLETGEAAGEDEFIDIDLDALEPNMQFIVLIISCHQKGNKFLGFNFHRKTKIVL